MKIQTTLELQFNNSQEADIFYQAFTPELEGMPMKRSEWQISKPDPKIGTIVFKISAEDATAFRATLNSLIQFAHIVERTMKIAYTQTIKSKNAD